MVWDPSGSGPGFADRVSLYRQAKIRISNKAVPGTWGWGRGGSRHRLITGASVVFDKEKFEAIFRPLKKNTSVAILLQRSPDPDALGAAAGFVVLLKEVFKLKAKIYHFGEISHPQNKSMKNVLHIPLYDGEQFDPSEHSANAVLDTDFHSSGFKTEGVACAVRIDHHQMELEDCEYEDVRPVGATCSIVWEYLQEYEIDLKEYADAATALLLGIKTDTLDFTSSNTSELDMIAYRSLLSCVNRDSLSKVNSFPLPKLVFETEAQAFKDKKIRNTTLVSFVGECSAQHRDIIPTIADRFSRMEGISTVVIMGIIDSCLIASVRSTDSRVDVYDLCALVFGKEYGGAKEGSGGARVPLGPVLQYIQDKDIKDKVMDDIVENFSNKIFENLGEE